MAAVYEVLKIITVPAFIAAFLYISIVYVIRPLIRKHRERYSQYVPIDSIIDTTSAARSRIISKVVAFIERRLQRRTRSVAFADSRESLEEDDMTFGEEEGETMVGFDLSPRARSTANTQTVHSDSRLSRDLEAGFKDDSEEEVSDDRLTTPVRNDTGL